ncbi:hypothetical protein ACFSTH_18920 [Paenibacillus yanchengensis]
MKTGQQQTAGGMGTTEKINTNSGYGYIPPPKKKRKRNLPLVIAFIFLLILVIGLNNANQKTDPDQQTEQVVASPEELKEQGLAFDKESWEDYLVLYNHHKAFVHYIDGYADGLIGKLDFYNFAKEFDSVISAATRSFNYGNTEDEKNYLKTFRTFVEAEKLAVKDLIKYLDSDSVKNLSTAQDNIKIAGQAITFIPSDRVVLLAKLGLSEEKIQEIGAKALKEIKEIDDKWVRK